MKALVIDIEATCWEGKGSKNKISEIIEVGVTEIELTSEGWTLGKTYSLPVQNILDDISPFCTQLTGWTQKEIDHVGQPYPEVVSRLRREFDSKNRLIVNWGKYDDKMFQEMSKIHKVAYPFSNNVLNLKAVFYSAYGQSAGVGRAMELLGMEFEGTPHRGADDSRNIARIYMELMNPLVRSYQLVTT